MSTVKQFVFQEQIASVDGIFIYAEKYNQSINSREPTATQNSTFDNQGDWTIPSTAGIDFYKSKFSNWSYSDASKNIKIIWTQGSAAGGSVPVIADYRIAHPTYNTSASKCKITFYNPQMRIGGLVAISNNTGYIVKYTTLYKVINNTNTFTTTGPIEITDTIPSYLQTSASSISIPSNIDIITMTNNLIQQGSSVTGGTRNDIDGLEYNLRVDKISGSPVGSSINLNPAIFSSYVIREYEGNLYRIDGSDGDSPPTITNNFSLICNAGLIKSANVNLQTDCSLLENSVSVITGVQEILENNFSLSVAGQVKYNINKILKQETELLGTTFNFRLIEPLTISAEYTSSMFGNIIRGLYSSFLLNNNFTANFTGNMIYDISVDYTWDDFAIDGKFTDNLLDGGIQYTWDGVDYYNWETWPNDNWDQTDISWDEWPSDTWNGSERIVTESNTQNNGNAIRGGIGSLLSTTSLSENAAFRIEGIPNSIRSDFLCDGSPSGKIGGTSTMVSDFIVDSFANYIINNAQNIEGAFDATLLANYIVQFLWSARSDFSLDITPTFKPGGVTNAQAIVVVDALAHAIYGPTKTLEGAFDPEFTARLFFTTDPYQIYRVLQETRQIFVDAESRGIEIAEEIRLNSIPAENRDWLVPQETRNMKLRIPPMVDRTTTPKVRRE